MEKENYDLMTLTIIKLGDEEYNGDKENEGFELLRFLNTIMYPHKEDFMEIVSDYIDFSENEELWKEEPRMFSLGQCVFEDGLKKGIEQGIAALIQNNIREGIPKERTIATITEFFALSEERAEEYFSKAAQKEESNE